MKRILMLTGLLAHAVTLVAADVPVYFTRQVRGTLVTGFTRRETIAVDPGRILRCDRTSAGSMLTLFKCDIEGTTATVTDESGRTLTLRFEKLNAFYKTHSGGAYNEYNFIGTFRENGKEVPLVSEARLVLWYYLASPNEINGSIGLPRYGLSAGLQAVEAPGR